MTTRGKSDIFPANADRRLILVVRSGPRVRRAQRQFEGEGGALAQTSTMNRKGAAQFLSGERAAVQTEAMSILPGCEPVAENSGQVLRRDAHTVVRDFDFHCLFAGELDTQDNELVFPAALVTG